ncbi:MAG: mandelate racemase/muconate lactonizing enzyme family protein [SAR202 cluster bacterium]|nr:mandelate racemase/muconate lactonizing enzyme family protein [SAR202 cluster bacterium]
MKITAIRPWLVKTKTSYWGELIFVEVSTDEGITGWGEVTSTFPAANRTVCSTITHLSSVLVGEDPTKIERLWHKAFRVFTYMGSRGASTHAISGIDIALWDILGKSLGKPIHALLGGAVRDSVDLYTHPGRYTTPKEAAAEAKLIKDSGHMALKMDPFPQMPEEKDGYLSGKMTGEAEDRAAETIAAVRAVVGPHIEILIDAHGRFDVPTAIRLANRLAEYKIGWFEEPVPVESYHALRQVKNQLKVPISVGERIHTRWEFIPIFENELADYVMPDVTWTGGISELKKISTMAEAYYVPVSPHDASGPINVLAGAHVMMTVPNFYRLETSRYKLDAYDVFIDEPLNIRSGKLIMPERPGLGIEMNREYLAANTVK